MWLLLINRFERLISLFLDILEVFFCFVFSKAVVSKKAASLLEKQFITLRLKQQFHFCRFTKTND